MPDIPIQKEEQVVEAPATFQKYEWNEVPSIARFKSLAKHLRLLNTIGVGNKKVDTEVERLSMLVGDWIIYTEDEIEEAITDKEKTRLTNRLGGLGSVTELLNQKNIDGAIEFLEDISR